MRDNTPVREALELKDIWISERHEQIWRAVFDCMFGDREPTSAKLSVPSSTTLPFFEKDVAFKKMMFAYMARHIEEILDLLNKGQLEELWARHRFIISYFLVGRLQVDSVTMINGQLTVKERWVNDFTYALTMGERGYRGPSDRSVHLNGVLIPNMWGVRRRTAYGLSACINYLLAAFMAGWRESYGKRFEFTWKHRDAEGILSKIRRYQHVIGFDVKQFDQAVSAKMLDTWADWLPVEDRAKILFKLAFHAPYFAPPQFADERVGHIMGNPMRLQDFRVNYGLPSGVAPNPDIGKWVMSSVYLCMIDDYFKDTLEFGVSRILEGQHERYAILNMGDDNLTLTNSDGFNQHVRGLLATAEGRLQLSPYLCIEHESPYAFLGNVLYEDEAGRTQVSPNLLSFIQNWLVAERSVGSKMRQFWPIGWKERKLHYMKAPGFNTLWGIFDQAYSDLMGIKPDVLASKAAEELRLPAIEVRSAADLDVLEDPSKLYYKYDAHDVSPEIYDRYVSSIPVEEVEAFVTPLLAH
jgi:hypothetical protein